MSAIILIKNAWIISNDEKIGDLRCGSILVRDGKIIEIAPEIVKPEGSEVIDGESFIAIPGFVDAHKHLWQAALRGICGDMTLLGYFETIRQNFIASYRPEDVRIGNLACALELLNSGSTSVLDHSHCIITPDHADAVIEATLEAGIRGVWAYGYCPVWESDAFKRHEDRIADAYRVKRRYFASDDNLLRMGVAITEQQLLPYEYTEMEVRSALDMNAKWTAHTHCGNGAAPISRGIYKLYAKNLVNDLAILSHCNEFTFNDFVMMNEVGAHFASSPDSEIYMGITKPVNFIEAIAAGTPISLGTDTVSCMSADMFANMRLTLNFARHQINAPAAAGFQAVLHQKVSVRDVFKMATINGARALGIDHLVGSLVPGKRADIVLIDANQPNLAPITDPIASLVLQGQVSNVDTVLVDGKIRKRHGKLVGVDLEKLNRDLSASHAYLQSNTKIEERDLAEEVGRWSSRVTEAAVDA
ncbi:cytosine/adenosine deaminase-related metal-dependent hydrolase [Rhizobium sp. SJZ105]|uniref:amidohydrolase family protein n=1 Tax=Rhizobium sp. SJZ105 TaxID=2572678 RepID=UPI00119F7470|nr:amidohydrolase family protein [Rhizobium sp. SJZ105]TWC76439.1 cytosine/adenosine deaminase-related metal-dependent hydrolase [Rhizobium sp. SJZ105]